MRQKILLLAVILLLSCVAIFKNVSSNNTQRTYPTAYIVHSSPTTSLPSSTPLMTVMPLTNTTLEPALKDASQRAFDRIIQLLQQGDYTGYEWQQSFNYNIGLLTYHRVCELEAYRLQSAVNSKDLPLIQQKYIELEVCIGEIK